MDLPDPGIDLGFPALQEDSLPTELSGKPNIYKSLGLKNLGMLSCMSVFCKCEMPVGFRRAYGDRFSPEI